MRRFASVCALLCLASPVRAEDPCAGRGARALLAITPFEAPAPSLRWDQEVTQELLVREFGAPLGVEQIPFTGKEEPGMVSLAHAWSFEEVRIETSQFEGGSEVWVNLVEISGATKPLRCGVRVGLPLARLREILGPPDHEIDESRCFELEQYPYDPSDPRGAGASLCVESGASGVVTRLRWVPTSRC